MEENIIDPFGTSIITDYSKLFTQLGLQPITEDILRRIKNPSRYLRRRIDFAHQDFDKFLASFEEGRPIAVISGIKPTNEFHLGSKVTAEKIIYFQKEFEAKVFYCIADLESLVDNQIPLNEAEKIAIGNVADILALGLDPKNAYIYRQSEEKRVTNLAYLFSRRITLSHMKNLYGERHLGLYFAAFTQAGDILLPQLEDFDGPKNVLVPIGLDQSPHIFLCRDIVERVKDVFHFFPPSAIYHKFFRALDGETKMSKRDPMSVLFLNDEPELAKRKIINCVDGGRKTVKEQRRLGGEPEKCVNYELALFHFVEDDNKLKKIYEECKAGKRLCGECKEEIADIVAEFLKKHQKKREKMMDMARKLLQK
ncbi:MAG: tryptophan--tRNA ligase [Candidatus Aenigmarchaeota archaeon]|nr:tryptophan--tRNA ligase [Candidatus Aenigmarchaeota archaeon]